jgi:signal transduction histidine kinase
MRGRLETALLKTRSPEEYRATLQELGVETERLAGLVEVLLQSATLVQGNVPGIDLQEQAERAHARWVDRFTDQGAELVLESDPAVAPLLAREFDVLVDNLLSNALKASPSGTVCLFRLSSSNGWVRIEVVDQGPGIPPERSEEIFERFARLDEGRSRIEGGFGIGLAVCRRIAEGRGGRVYLRPTATGAHFIIELPC